MRDDITILYAEDESQIRSKVLKSLQRRFKNIYEAENGQMALEIFKQHDIDLLITDIKMPYKDGLELAGDILALDPSARIIVTTAFSEIEFLTKAIELGINSYILKPIDISKLFIAIDKCTESIILEKQKLELEKKLRISQNNIDIISSLVSEFYFSFGIDTKQAVHIEWIGGAFEQITGYQVALFTSFANLHDIILESDRYKVNKFIHQLMNNVAGSIEFMVITPDLQEKLLLMKSHPHWDQEANRVTHIYGSVQDITVPRAIEQKFTEMKARYEILFRNTPMGAMLSKMDGTIIDINDALLNLTGYSQSELQGKKAMELYEDPEDRERLIDQIANNDYVNYVRNFQTTLIKKNSQSVDVELTSCLAQFQNELILLTLIQDITKRKRSETELLELTEKLSQSDALKSLLFDIISHDLRNQVGNLQMVSELLVKQYPDDDKVALLGKGSQNLIKVLLKASSISQLSLGENLKMEEINIKKLLQEIIPIFRYRIQKNDMTLENKITEDFIVQANPLINEVILNYLSNAIQHAPNGSQIYIEAEVKNNENLLRVCDTGETIAPELRQEVFKRKQQGAGESRIGHGLGLAIVYRIAQAHNGRAWVEPNEPTGNVFCFAWPR